MSLQNALTAFILIMALIYSTKHVHALISFLGGKIGGGGSALGSIGGAVAGKAVSSGMSTVRSTAKKAGGFVYDKGNKLGAWGLDKVRDKLDDAGWLDKGEEKSGGIGGAFKNIGKDALATHGGNVADKGREMAHKVASKVPGVNKEKHQALANMYANKRQDHMGLQAGLRSVDDVDKAKMQYDNDSAAHNLSQHRLDSLLNHSPEAQELKHAQADMDAFKASDPLALKKHSDMESAKSALQEAQREQHLKQKHFGGVSEQDKQHLKGLQNNYNLAEGNYNKYIDNSDPAKNLKQAQQKYDTFVHSKPVKDAREAVEQTGFQMAKSKDAYMKNKHKFDNLSLQKKMLPQTYDMHKELIKSLSKPSKKAGS